MVSAEGRIQVDNVKVSAEMLSMIAELEAFRGSWIVQQDEKPEALKSLKKVATIESVGSSNRIEGNPLTDVEIATILSNLKISSFSSRDEQEVVGYARLMEDIFNHYELIFFTENYIKQLHKTLLSYCDKDEAHRGEYKKLSNSVAAFDEGGNQIGAVFETTTPFQTPMQIRALVQQTRELLEDKALHPLLVIALFVVHFLAIHPFQDGNGRLSRALTTLLLLKAGYVYVPYASMESVIEQTKEAYYQSLRRTQKTLKEKADYEAWLNFFLKTLQKQKRKLEKKIKFEITTNINTNTRSDLSLLATRILELFDKTPRLTTPQVAQTLDANQATVKKTIADLVKAGRLIKNGSTRGAWYEKG